MNDRQDKLWSLFSGISIFSMENGPIIFMLATNEDRVFAFYFVCVFVAATYIVAITRLSWHKPAPYWVSADIETYDCFAGYSSPGPHTTISTTILLTLWTTLSFGPDPKCNNTLKRVIGFIFIFLWTFIINYGHLYNGDVGLDQ